MLTEQMSTLQHKEYSSAVTDYEHAIALSPKASALWNRGLAKEETFDKDGAVADFTKAIELKNHDQDARLISKSYDARSDLYVKLESHRKALQDYNTLIGLRLRDVTMSINLEFFRSLYPEYANVDDARLKDKLHFDLLRVEGASPANRRSKGANDCARC